MYICVYIYIYIYIYMFLFFYFENIRFVFLLGFFYCRTGNVFMYKVRTNKSFDSGLVEFLVLILIMGFNL